MSAAHAAARFFTKRHCLRRAVGRRPRRPCPTLRKPMPNRGQLVVVTMFGVALLAAAFAWAWNYQRSRRCLDFFGAHQARLIRTAPRVEILTPDGGSIDISKAPGLLNARSSLLDDASFEWQAVIATDDSGEATTVCFTDRDQSASLVFDFERETLTELLTGKRTKLDKKTCEGW